MTAPPGSGSIPMSLQPGLLAQESEGWRGLVMLAPASTWGNGSREAWGESLVWMDKVAPL